MPAKLDSLDPAQQRRAGLGSGRMPGPGLLNLLAITGISQWRRHKSMRGSDELRPNSLFNMEYKKWKRKENRKRLESPQNR